MENRDFRAQFDARDAQRALSGTGIAVPPLSTYAPRLWDYWERNLDPDLFRERSLAELDQGQEGADHGRVERHRARDRAEGRRGRRRGPARLAHAREARGGGVSDRGARRHGARPPGRPLGPRGHRSPRQGGARRARRRRRAHEQRGPLDPALRGALLRPLPRLRENDAAELLRRAEAHPRVPAGDARAQVGPHHQRQLDRRADEHAALLRVRRLEVGARRVLALHGARGGRRTT